MRRRRSSLDSSADRGGNSCAARPNRSYASTIALRSERVTGRLDQVVDGLVGVAGLLEVQRQDRASSPTTLGVELLERLAHRHGAAAPLLLEQRLVGRVLDQRVAEQVLELGLKRCERESGPAPRGCRAECRDHRVVPPGCRRLEHALQDAHRELAADHRGDAQAALCLLPAAGRCAPAAGRAASPGSRRCRSPRWPPSGRPPDDRAALDEHADDLLDEERVAFGAGQGWCRAPGSGSDSISSRLETSSRLSSRRAAAESDLRQRVAEHRLALADEAPAGRVRLGAADEQCEHGHGVSSGISLTRTSTDAGSAQWMSSRPGRAAGPCLRQVPQGHDHAQDGRDVAALQDVRVASARDRRRPVERQ